MRKTRIQIEVPPELAEVLHEAESEGRIDWVAHPVRHLGGDLYARTFVLLLDNEEVGEMDAAWYFHIPRLVRWYCRVMRKPYPVGDPRICLNDERPVQLERQRDIWREVMLFVTLVGAVGVAAALLAVWWITR